MGYLPMHLEASNYSLLRQIFLWRLGYRYTKEIECNKTNHVTTGTDSTQNSQGSEMIQGQGQGV